MQPFDLHTTRLEQRASQYACELRDTEYHRTAQVVTHHWPSSARVTNTTPGHRFHPRSSPCHYIMSTRSACRSTKRPSCSNAALEAVDVPKLSFLDLPPEVRRIIYACLLEPDSQDHAYDRMPYHHGRVTRGPNEIVIFWDENLIHDIRGLVLASKTCFKDFQSSLPAVIMCMHEADYQGDMKIPAMFRKRIVTLVLTDCLMHITTKISRPGCGIEGVRQKLSLFP